METNTIEKAIFHMMATIENNPCEQGKRHDAATLVINAFEDAGVPVRTNGAVYTGNMYAVFTKTGFEDVSGMVNRYTAEGLIRGDVLLDPSRCAYVYLGNGKAITAVRDEQLYYYDGIDYVTDIISYRSAIWQYALRYIGDTEK